MTAKTFSNSDLTPLEGNFTERRSEAFVYLGLVNEAGADVSNTIAGTVLIGKRMSGGTDVVPLKEIVALTNKDDKASRYILPANQELVVIPVGATGIDLYCEVQISPISPT